MRKQLLSRAGLDQQGIISITVTVVFILVITLIVLGFSQVSQRNGRIALDRQLSTQANYAAEVGLNDTMKKVSEYIDSGYSVGGLPFPPQPDCTGPYTQNDGKVYTDGESVKYTCLIVSHPPDLRATNVNDTAVVWPVNATPGETLNSVPVKWGRAGNTQGMTAAGCPAVGSNVPASSWASSCPFALVRVDFIPDTATASAFQAAQATMTLFLYPRSGGAVGQYAYANNTTNPYTSNAGAPQGLVGYASCNQNECSAEITGLNVVENGYIRIKPFYQPASTVRVSSTGTELVGGASSD